MLADDVDIRIVQLMLGHASIQTTQRYLNVTDEAQEGIGGELEQQSPIAAPCGGKLSASCRHRIVPVLSPGTGKCGYGGSQPTTPTGLYVVAA
ncbi:MAG: hypothetical protein ABIS06_21595 [Vicinamibacterales bacterium]